MRMMTAKVPQIGCQPPAVDFIDNEMAEHHDLFKDPPAQYNSQLKKYVPVTSISKFPLPVDDEDRSAQPCRPDIPAVQMMHFWNSIFTKAMETFEEKYEPLKGRAESGYDIRSRVSWNDVEALLQRARVQYDGSKRGFCGRMKKLNRRVVDGSGPAHQVIKLVPENDYISPLRAVIEICLDVGSTCYLRSFKTPLD